MCGFAGIVRLSDQSSFVEDKEWVKKMTDEIISRGPDDFGINQIGSAVFGFRRLSIIDLENGHQPMIDQSESVMLVFNGEIYNFQEIKSELVSKGMVFSTHSDTEVILQSYIYFGEGFVSKLRGMFAIAIFDPQKRKMMLYRDRMGIKPLYWGVFNGRLIFGSEMKSIVKVVKHELSIDPIALDQFFSYGYIMDDRSIFNEIKKVKSAEYITWDLKGIPEQKSNNYWNPSFEKESNVSWDEALEIVGSAIDESVSKHLISDVPVGAFLSGGIDSNMVVSAMQKKYRNKIHTFTIGFHDDKYDESKWARISARKWQTEHHEFIMSPDDLVDIEKIILQFDEPFADSSAIPTYYVSKLAASTVKVVLSGDGGDELFAGYDVYQRMLGIHRWNFIINPLRPLMGGISKWMDPKTKGKRFLYNLSLPANQRYAQQVQINQQEKTLFYTDQWRQHLSEENGTDAKMKFFQESNAPTYLTKMQELDLRTFMKDDVLVKVDRMSMLHSLEVRVPFIDHVFLESVNAIPDKFKINGKMGKYILRECGKGDLPEEIYTKPKSGFTIPIFKWYKGDFRKYVVDRLEYLKKSGIIKPTYLDNIIQNQGDFGSLSTRIWPLVVFSVWLENFTEK
jgi:asparagine synthase (glutamine-hydrolysing)